MDDPDKIDDMQSLARRMREERAQRLGTILEDQAVQDAEEESINQEAVERATPHLGLTGQRVPLDDDKEKMDH